MRSIIRRRPFFLFMALSAFQNVRINQGNELRDRSDD